jgi:dihydrofolate synthase / folylpolyglutamate synthase
MEQRETFTTAAEVFAWMERTCRGAFQPGLERMEWVLERLHHPERRCKFIHIAGTNGKGSTAAMISSVLRAAGYSTGLFISPYIVHWSERIQYEGEFIAESAFVKWANYLYPHLEKMEEHGPGKPSPFEFWTLLAICYFAFDVCPWFVVWETGLGGRLDSTNVVYPLVSVITQIGLDHTDQLGQDLKGIAQEKAGIIKPGVPVVCGAEEAEVLQVIQAEANRKKCAFYTFQRDFTVEFLEFSPNYQRFHFTNAYRTLSHLAIPLLGEHQLKNAATALMTLEVLRQNDATILEDEHVERGMKSVFWPGRLEKWSEQPLLLLDGAHNLDGIQALVSALLHYYTYDRFIVVLAMMRDKDVLASIRPLVALADLVLITQVQDQPRSLSASELAHLLKEDDPGLTIHPFPAAEEGVRWAQTQANETDLILITGSLYLVAEVRALLHARGKGIHKE